MIRDFALEPALVAAWHDRRVAYPILCQMGLGHRRVPCAFPTAAWQKLVIQCFESESFGMDPAAQQQARKSIEVLLRHLQECGTRRNGKLAETDEWVDAAIREHRQFPFGGIVVRSAAIAATYIVAADQLGISEFPAWTPPVPPVVREPKALAAALAPLLRSAAQVRFVDPHFDADDQTFLGPMSEYLAAAQKRRSVGDLQVQVHFWVNPRDVEQAGRLEQLPVTEDSFAKKKLAACERRLAPLLEPGVSVQAFSWGESSSGARMHNRYVLTEVGGVALLTGLDENTRGKVQTDDLAVLSREQHLARWAEFCAEGTTYRLIASRKFASSRSKGR